MHPFVSTQRTLDLRSRSFVFSVAAHVVFFAAILTARVTTASSGGALATTDKITERLRFIEVAPAPPHPIRSSAPPARSHATVPTKPTVTPDQLQFRAPDLPAVPDLPSGVEAALPADLDFTSKVTDSLDFGPVKASALLGDGSGLVAGASAIPTNGIYTMDMVEKMVMPYPNNPKPAYPSSLLSAGVEQTFTVHFVVDTTGRVDEKSMDFPESAHRLFIESVRRSLKRSRYRPAEVGGHRVRQLVEQQFTFRISR